MTSEELRTLTLFNTVESRPEINQRQLARELEVSLGLTNTYFQRVLKKGWIRAQQGKCCIPHAATKFWAVYSPSTLGTVSLEEITGATDRPKMFQIYILKGTNPRVCGAARPQSRPMSHCRCTLAGNR